MPPGGSKIFLLHHISLPTLFPVLISPWMFSFVTPDNKPSKVNFLLLTGVRMILPSSSETSTSAPFLSFASTAKAFGILKARLFPHCCIFVVIFYLPRCIYNKYTIWSAYSQGLEWKASRNGVCQTPEYALC